MSDIDQLREQCRKAAAIGFAQSLENRGYDQEKKAALTVAYAKPDGILVKRAAAKAKVIQGIDNCLNILRSGK